MAVPFLFRWLNSETQTDFCQQPVLQRNADPWPRHISMITICCVFILFILVYAATVNYALKSCIVDTYAETSRGSLRESAASTFRKGATVHAKLFQNGPVGSLDVRRPARVAALRVVLVRRLVRVRRAGEGARARLARLGRSGHRFPARSPTRNTPQPLLRPGQPTESGGKTARLPARAKDLRRRRTISRSTNEQALPFQAESGYQTR